MIGIREITENEIDNCAWSGQTGIPTEFLDGIRLPTPGLAHSLQVAGDIT